MTDRPSVKEMKESLMAEFEENIGFARTVDQAVSIALIHLERLLNIMYPDEDEEE